MAKETNIVPTGVSSSSGQHHSELQNIGGIWVDNREDAWIQYDLGSEMQINAVGISFDQADEIRYTFSLETAAEGGGSWSTAIVNKTSTKGLGLKEYKFHPRLARSIKLMIHDNSSADKYRAAIDEFKIGYVPGRVKPKPKIQSKSKVKVKSKAKTKSKTSTRKR